jgi:hypothetical protein
LRASACPGPGARTRAARGPGERSPRIPRPRVSRSHRLRRRASASSALFRASAALKYMPAKASFMSSRQAARRWSSSAGSARPRATSIRARLTRSAAVVGDGPARGRLQCPGPGDACSRRLSSWARWLSSGVARMARAGFLQEPCTSRAGRRPQGEIFRKRRLAESGRFGAGFLCSAPAPHPHRSPRKNHGPKHQ